MEDNKLPYWIGSQGKLAVNFGVGEAGLLHAGIYLAGTRYGALEESLTTDNYLIWTLQSMMPDKILFWAEDLPSHELGAVKWWARNDELNREPIERPYSYRLDSNPFNDFYDTAIFRNSESVFFYWRLRVDVDFWKEFPSMAILANPGAWRFEASIIEFEQQINEVYSELSMQLTELRKKKII